MAEVSTFLSFSSLSLSDSLQSLNLQANESEKVLTILLRWSSRSILPEDLTRRSEKQTNSMERIIEGFGRFRFLLPVQSWGFLSMHGANHFLLPFVIHCSLLCRTSDGDYNED